MLTDWMIVNNEWKWMWQGAVMAKFKEQSRNLSRET
jgi:hypothetical protein